MPIDPQLARRTIVEAEFRALQALCQQNGQGPIWDRGMELLVGYRFRDPLHQLVFDVLRECSRDHALRSLLIRPAGGARAALLQQLTRLGFPDVDVEPFFHEHAMSAELVLSILDHLLFTARLDQRPDFAGQL